MSKVDLHVHTTASDGKFAPEEVVRKAHALGLEVIAICDHDTTGAFPAALEAAKAFPRLKVIPGVEINTDVPSGEVHVLGYFIDFTNPELNTSLEAMRTSRLLRAQKMLNKLKHQSIYLDFKRVQEIAAGGAIGRPHIAQAMLEKGYIHTFREAFAKYIGKGCPAYVERDKMTPSDAVKLVLRAGGLPVLAHPFTFEDTEAMVAELKSNGLAGIEAYYDSYTPEQTGKLLGFAEKYQLITTGGSDFHGLDAMNETPLGGVDVPLPCAERLIALRRI